MESPFFYTDYFIRDKIPYYHYQREMKLRKENQKMSKKKIFIPALLAGGAAVAAYMFAKNNELTEETAEDGYVFDNGKHCAVYRERGPVNVTMIGGRHTGKTDLVCDNILSANKSCVVFDKNGEKYRNLKDTLKNSGFAVGRINLMKEHANVYNPISFLEDDMDVITFIRYLMDIQLEGETDFLRKAEEMFLSACVHYLMQYKEDADIHMLYGMIPAVENEGDYLVDDDALTKTTQLFSVLDETSSAKRYYKAFLQAAGLMINETLVKCKERLNMLLPLDGDYEDESGIVDLRDKKEAIFVTFPAGEYYTPAHEFYVKSFMTHLFKVLTSVNAEKLQDSDPVCIFVDDYEYVKNTDMFVGTASILRKYRVSLFVTLSNVLLNDADDVISLLSCSNACVYLGGCRDSYAEHFLAKYFDTDYLIDAIKIKYVD